VILAEEFAERNGFAEAAYHKAMSYTILETLRTPGALIGCAEELKNLDVHVYDVY
jgi:hypothetical protein